MRRARSIAALTMTKARAILIGFLFVTIVGAMDFAAGHGVSLFVLQIIPVMFVTWFVNLGWGIFFAVLMTVMAAVTNVYLAPVPSSSVYYRSLDIGSDFRGTLFLVFMQQMLRQSFERMQRSSRTDALTGCLNKGGFTEQLQSEIDRSRRYRHPLALIYFDCDNFKAVNDAHGHHTGDALLATVGRILRKRIRSVDSAARLGGDEFAVLLRENDGDAALKVAGQIKRALDEAMRDRRWPVTFSIGVAGFKHPPVHASDALKEADALMYAVKKHGKDGILMRHC